MVQYIFEFVLALAFLIIVHELGHFLACRIFKVEVEEFGLGLPPRALTLFRSSGTDFTLNWIPLGGFVRPRGQDDPQITGGLAAAKPLVRISVALAGPVMNLILAVVLYAASYVVLGEPDPTRLDQVQVQSIMQASPAEAAGLQIGDIILKVNGQDVSSVEQAREIIYAHLDQTITMHYQRGDTVFETSVTPLSSRPPEQGATGLLMGPPVRPIGLPQAALNGVRATYYHIGLLFEMLGKFVTGQSTGEVNFVGPIGIGRMYVGMREAGPASGLGSILDVFGFLISISISLAIFNLLPIPALDGGRILLTLPELLFRRRLETKVENWLINITFLLLLGLLIFVSLRDIIAPFKIIP